MKILQYHHSNFDLVRKTLRKTQNATRHGANGRILFNNTLKRFELYEPNELDKINSHMEYTLVEEAMSDYITNLNLKQEGIMKEVDQSNEVDVIENNDNLTVEENAENTLKAISAISERTSQENKEKLLNVIAQIFKLDVVSESDILKTILEHGEYRKILSILLAELGVEISYTRAGFDLTVSSAKLKFNRQSEYRLEDYRMGVVQALPIIKQISDTKATLDQKEESLLQKDRVIQNQEKKILELNSQIELLTIQSKTQRDIKPVVPIFYHVMFISEDVPCFIKVEKGSKQTEDGSYPTKRLGMTKVISNATKFTNSEALAQVARLVKFAKNLAFIDIKEKSPKELAKFFSVVRVLIEKPEIVSE